MKSYLNRPSWSNTWMFSILWNTLEQAPVIPNLAFVFRWFLKSFVHCMRLNMVLERCAKSEAEPPGPCQAANLVLV